MSVFRVVIKVNICVLVIFEILQNERNNIAGTLRFVASIGECTCGMVLSQ